MIFLLDYIKNNIQEIITINWDKKSKNPNLDFKLVAKYPHDPWNFKILSKHPKLNIYTVKKYHRKDWDWKLLSAHPKINYNFVKNHPDKEWDWYVFSKRKDFYPFFLVEDFPNNEWDWQALSQHSKLPLYIIEKFPQKNWDWKFIIEKFSKKFTGPCSICQEDLNQEQYLNNKEHYLNNQEPYTLVCGHTFHTLCLQYWLSYKLKCPNCRISLI